MSRHQIDVATPLKTLQVATSKRGRDTKPPLCSLNHVATSNRCRDITQAYPGRDTKIMSRPFWRLPYVAIPFLPTVGFPGRDTEIHVATSHTATHVATPFPPNQSRPGRDTTSWSRPHAQPNSVLPSARSRHQKDVATPTPPVQFLPCTQKKKEKKIYIYIYIQLPLHTYSKKVAFLLLLRCSSLSHCIHTTSNIFIKIILFNLLQFYTVKP